MSYSVSGTMITLTRGDTFSALITITDLNDNQYIPMNGDRIRFAMKNDYNDETPLLMPWNMNWWTATIRERSI